MATLPTRGRSSKRDSFERVFSRLRRVPGWLTDPEAKFLFRLARETKSGRVVELGAYQGRSTIALATGLRCSGHAKAGVKLVTIDTFRGSPEHQRGARYFDPSVYNPAKKHVDTRPAFDRNLAEFGVTGMVEVWEGEIEAAASRFHGRVDLLFVDADHRYEAVRRHLEQWIPKVAAGGIVVLHDVGGWPGPTRAAADLQERGFRRYDQVDSALALRCQQGRRPQRTKRHGRSR